MGRKDAERRFKYILSLLANCVHTAQKIESEIGSVEKPMFNFGNFELRRLIKDFMNMSEEMQKISLESTNIARNQHELRYAESLNRLTKVGVAKNVSFLGFDSSDNPEYFIEICDLIFRVNSGHRDIFTKL